MIFIKASDRLPESGKPESLIGRQCRIISTKEPVIITRNNRILFEDSGYGVPNYDNIEWLDESPIPNTSTEVMSPEEWWIDNKDKQVKRLYSFHEIKESSELMDAYASYVLSQYEETKIRPQEVHYDAECPRCGNCFSVDI